MKWATLHILSLSAQFSLARNINRTHSHCHHRRSCLKYTFPFPLPLYPLRLANVLFLKLCFSCLHSIFIPAHTEYLLSIRCWVTSSVTVWKLLFKQQFKWIDFSLNQTAQPMMIMVYIANVAALTTRISFKSLQRKIPFSCIHKNNQQNSRNYLILLVQIIGDSWKARKCAATQYKQHQ